MSDAVVLPWPFEVLRQRLAAGGDANGLHVLASLAASLANETEFDLSQADSLQDGEDQSLYSAIFGYCLEYGLTEDERALVARTFTDASRLAGGEGGHV